MSYRLKAVSFLIISEVRDMDRNIWDPQALPSSAFSTLARKGSVVELCIYIFTGSAKNEKSVRSEVEEAGKIWCQSGINVQAIHLKQLPPLPASEPLDLNSPDLARQISCGGMSDAVRNQLFSIGRPNCPGNIHESIAVYYIPGRRLADGFASGCHQFRTLGGDGLPEHIILLTDEASGQVLAHELGHALFARKDDSNNWFNGDPDNDDPNNDDPDQKKEIHSKNPQNLMFPNVPPIPVISPKQSAQANSSDLVLDDQDLVYGFIDNTPITLKVTMEVLYIHSISDELLDELFNADCLESWWRFHVQTGKTNANGDFTVTSVNFAANWTNSCLRATRAYDLRGLVNVNITMASDDELLIAVFGGEGDNFYNSDDSFPVSRRIFRRTDSNWGSGFTTHPSGVIGRHLDHPPKNDEIEYSVSYMISVASALPVDIPPFRIIC
jgi:hypothetical protein